METDRHETRFRLTLIAMIVLLFAVPIGTAKALDLDARTPVTIAEDTLRENYDLVLIDDAGHAIPEDSGAVTQSEFSMTPGSTTEGVPFKLHGKLVHCTISMPDDDPRSVTATCDS
ncbi:hypothetical protein ASC77_16605 [Nocardioides sp. Root1257]|nr:hypothetical protein ASC77_16605 [Nocardioides sp. Root1257]KRC45266.1 hypothetical protein ASE24_17555 [Nocardioides sp. Root224]